MPAPYFSTVPELYQPRTWALDGSRTQGTSTSTGFPTEIFATDLISVRPEYFAGPTGGIGANLLIGERLGFYFEKADNPFNLSYSDPSLIETFFDYELTGVTFPGSISGQYTFAKTHQNIVAPGPPTAVTAKNTNFLITGGRDFAVDYITNNNFPLTKFGDYRIAGYAGNPNQQADRNEERLFQLRGLAITNLKSTPERIEVDGVVRQVTITGDITVYPNQDTNGIAGWTPTNPIDWRIVIKSPTVPQSQWRTINGTIATPSAPNSAGVVGSFSTTWNGLFSTTDGPPYDAIDTAFVQMVIEARAIMQVTANRNTVTPLATTGVLCKKCQSKRTNQFAEFLESINIFNSPLSDVNPTVAHSSLQSQDPTGSMGFGWFSTESIKIFDLNNDDTDLVYCDETGMCRRWLGSGSGVYTPVMADNRMRLEVFPSSPNAKYVVSWRDGSRREFGGAVVGTDPCDQYALKKHVNSNGHETTYTRSVSYLAVSDGKGRVVYHHFNTGELQPRVINDNPDSALGRRYVLDYYMNGSEQRQLLSITDPVGDKVVFVYGGAGRIAERREELTNHHRSVFYTYDSSGTGRLASLKVSSTLLQPDPTPDVVTDHFEVQYSYDVPFIYDADGTGGNPPVTYNTTKTVVKDLQGSGNPDRVSYLAHDSLSRIVAEFEESLDDLDGDNVIDDLTYIATLHEYTDANDPWLRTKTTQVNKGATTFFEYTARGNLKKVTDTQGNETLMSYVEENSSHPAFATFPDLVTEIRRPAPDQDNAPTTYYPTTKLTYDPANANLVAVEDAQGKATAFRYNSDGQVNRIIDRRGFKTYVLYDSRARVSEVHVQKSLTPSPLITELVNETAADFRSVTLSYDGYDNLTGVLDSNGNTKGVLFDAVNRPTTVTDGNGDNYVFEYLDRVLEQVTLPDNNVPSANVRLAKVVSDSAGRPIAVNREDSNNASQLRVGFAFDGFSQIRALARIKNGIEKSHTAEYDRQGRTIKTTDANGKSSTVGYEPYCVGFASTSARGVRRKASFDTLCRLTEVKVGTPASNPLEVASASETRTFDYDDLGRLIGTVQNVPARYGQARFGQDRYGGVNATRGYLYDSLDRLTKVTFEDGKEMAYLYDEEGNVTQVTEDASGSSKVTQFSYYGDGKLYQVTYVRGSGNQVFTYAYDPGGRPLTLTYPTSTGIVAHFKGPSNEVGWDGNGQLLHLRYVKGGVDIRRFAFSYDDAGNRITQLDVTPAKATSWAYGYDWLDRLESVKKAEAATVGALGALQLVSVYTFDAADNRTEFQVPNLNPALTETFRYSFDDADNIMLVEKKVGAGSYASFETFGTPDDDGNMTSRTRGGVTTTYTWDDFNRLAAISTSDNSKKQSHTFGVNGFRRKKKDKDGVETTEYAAGLATAVAKAQGGDTVTYLMGHRIMGFERSSDGAMFWYIKDGLSTVRDVVNASGEVKASYEFSEYGQRIATSENGVSSQKAWVGGSSVQDEAADTGLMMMGHRFYDPDLLGRFLNRDPIGFRGGLNLFEYASGSPVMKADASGLNPLGLDFNANSLKDEYNLLFNEHFMSDEVGIDQFMGTWKGAASRTNTVNEFMILSMGLFVPNDARGIAGRLALPFGSFPNQRKDRNGYSSSAYSTSEGFAPCYTNDTSSSQNHHVIFWMGMGYMGFPTSTVREVEERTGRERKTGLDLPDILLGEAAILWGMELREMGPNASTKSPEFWKWLRNVEYYLRQGGYPRDPEIS
jgi:RHS repeat-associated protein